VKNGEKNRRKCPQCSGASVRRSHRQGVRDYLLGLLFIYPFRCQDCNHRFRALVRGKRLRCIGMLHQHSHVLSHKLSGWLGGRGLPVTIFLSIIKEFLSRQG